MKKHPYRYAYAAAASFALVLATQVALVLPVFAAQSAIYFDASHIAVEVGQELTVGIFIDTDQPTNAYAIDITYPNRTLELIGFDNSRSIINVWPREPLVYESGQISFKGGSLQPFSGNRGEIITIRFRALEQGSSDLKFFNPALYLANGKGTKIIPEIRNLDLAIEYSKLPTEVLSQSTYLTSVSADIKPPEISFIALIRDPINPDQKLLSIKARDPDSGIKSIFYESREWFFYHDPRSAQNPTALPLNVWSVRVSTYDNAGNRGYKTIYDWGSFAKGPLMVLVLILLATAYPLYKTWRDKRIIGERCAMTE